MKKLLFFLCLGVAAAALAAAVFCLAFDANRYLPLVKERLQGYLGNPVGIDRIALRLGWDGPAAELEGFSVYPEADGGDGTPVLWLERLRVAFDALPLLRKEIRISSVSAVRPRLRLTKNAQGQWEVFSEKEKTGGEETPAPSSPAPSAGSPAGPFSVGALRIEDAEIRLRDESGSPAREVVLSHLDAVFKNPRLDDPFDFDLRLAVFGQSQNLSAHGRITVSGSDGGLRLQDFRLRADFAKIDAGLLAECLPAFEKMGLDRAEGILSVDSKELFLGERRVTGERTKIRIAKGALYFKRFKNPVEAIEAEGEVMQDTFTLSRLDARIGHGTLAASAQTTGMEGNPSTAFELRAEGLSLVSFLPARSAEAPRFEGELSVSLKGAGEGWDAAEFSRTLAGGGELALERGTLVNFNLLREVLGRLSAVPGFGEELMGRLPPVYQERMAVAHTTFAPIRTFFKVGDGGIYFDSLQAATEDFAIGIGGRLGMDGVVNAQSVIRTQPQLSAAVCQAAPEAQYFLGPQGQLEVPAKIDGTLNHLRILPDTRAIITNIAVTRGQELLSDLIQRKMGKSEPAAADAGEDAGKPDYKKLLQGLF
ncbi:MAG: DUF748 domain-containing protein [Candidatus Omnitrophica bacterium]|nr:DUF748 domain-containing protein [Candidatus Omnitrophota bacterium]